MIFNSLINLIETDTDGVYKFICEIFLENNLDLSLDERLYIFAVINKFKNGSTKDFNHFLLSFKNRKKILNIISKFSTGEEYECFVSNKEVCLSKVKDSLGSIISKYIDLFGTSNVKNM